LGYSLSIERHEDGYLAYFPALPGCHTWGKTYEAAVRNAEEALELYLETLASHGDQIPDDQTTKEPVSLGVTVRTPVIS
jgi:predicted RNase H-like HicB family nuclease